MPKPPFKITSKILSLCTKIEKHLGRYEGLGSPVPKPQLRRSNKIKTIWSTVAIEGNQLYEHQVETILEGKKVVGPQKDILEVRNAFECYEQLNSFSPTSEKDLLTCHKILMKDILEKSGIYRNQNIGIIGEKGIRHVGPKPAFVPKLMADLFKFMKENEDISPLILSSVVHYEIEFIHPFQDGNGRMGRLWQHLILAKHHPIFEFTPIESLIHDDQNTYYDTLSAADKTGDSTVFIEFMLDKIYHALDFFTQNLKRVASTFENRIKSSKETFKGNWFTRGEYLKLFEEISSATATRDLKQGVDIKTLETKGELRLKKYKFL